MAFRFEQLTLKGQEALQKAQRLAQERGHPRLEAMHLLAALLSPDQQVVRSLLAQLGVNPAQILKAAEEGLSIFPKTSGGELTISPELNQVLEAAQAEAGRMKDQYVSVEHLLIALLKVKSRVQTLLEALGITEKEVLQALQKVRGGQRVTDQSPEDKYQALEKYGKDLVELARNGKIDPVIGRDCRDQARRPGLEPPDQEQSGLDRRARRGQDGHRRGTGPAHRLGRRAREPSEPAADRAGHGGTDRGHQVPRRI